MRQMIAGLVLIVVVLISGCVDTLSEQTQGTEQTLSEEVSYTGVDIKNLTGSTPVIISIKPNAGTVGAKIVVTGKGFTDKNNNIAFRLVPEGGNTTFKIGYITSIKSNDGETIEFVLQDGLDSCAYLPEEKTLCPAILLLLKTGTTYPVYIVNRNGTSNSINFTVK